MDQAREKRWIKLAGSDRRRAVSLERGSLLDVLLTSTASRAQVWKTVLEALEEAGASLDKNEPLRVALDEIGKRVDSLIPLDLTATLGSGLRPGVLTRSHIRRNMSFFLASRDSQHMLPFDRLGSGTTNALVFALLSAIAEAKSNAIFAMEEPEISLAPHTQRVIVHRLREVSAQSIIASHSPYVAEMFLPDNLILTGRRNDGVVKAVVPTVEHEVKEKTLRQDFREKFAEGLFARAVAIVEGVSELWGIPAAAEVLSRSPDSGVRSFDLEGLVFIPAGGEGSLGKFAGFFESLQIPAHVIADRLPGPRIEEIEHVASSVFAHPHHGFEALLAEEMPVAAIRRLLSECHTWADWPQGGVPADSDPDTRWRERMKEILKARKGEGYGARMLRLCNPDELPPSLVQIVEHLRTQLRTPHQPAPVLAQQQSIRIDLQDPEALSSVIA